MTELVCTVREWARAIRRPQDPGSSHLSTPVGSPRRPAVTL